MTRRWMRACWTVQTRGGTSYTWLMTSLRPKEKRDISFVNAMPIAVQRHRKIGNIFGHVFSTEAGVRTACLVVE